MPGNLQTIPASVLESWPTPNYLDPYRRTGIVPLAIVLQAAATLMVVARLVLRARQQAGPLGFDDALLIPAWLGATMFTTVLLISNMHYGTDRHIWDVPPADFSSLALMAWLSELAFLISTCCTKVSILLFYRRLVHGTYSKRWKYATIGAITLTSAYCLAFVLALIFSCRPTEAYWMSYSLTYTADYKCTDTQVLNPLSGVLSVLSDLYAVFLPMAMLWHLDAPIRQRVALNAVFSIGLLVVGAGAVRTYYLSLLGTQYDISWIGYDVYLWATLETQLALICASAPALRVLFREYLSDPISRAIRTARSADDRSMTFDSRAGTPAMASFHSRAQRRTRGSSFGSLDNGEKSLVRHQVRPSLVTVSEREYDSRHSATSSEPHVIKTPADYEAYALQNLEKNKTPLGLTFLRPPSDQDVSRSQRQASAGWR